jgi:CRISPR-associated protein Cmx8
MAKPAKPAEAAELSDPSELVVEYDLFELPTAFHKAGLAGLILLIESLKSRAILTADEAKYDVTPTGANVTFTEVLLRKLMDDIYDAEAKELAVKSKWSGAEVVRTPTAAEKEAGTPFVYRVVEPKGAFFDNVFDGKKEIWRKLWRDMLWNIPRARPTTREPYNQRAEGHSCKEGLHASAELAKVGKARAKSSFHTAPLSSSLFPGAQAVNAENVAFEGRAEQNLLLHFDGPPIRTPAGGARRHDKPPIVKLFCRRPSCVEPHRFCLPVPKGASFAFGGASWLSPGPSCY